MNNTRAPKVRRARQGHPELVSALRGYQVAHAVFDDAIAHKLGVNRTASQCIDILDQHQPMTAGALAHAAGLSTGAVTFVLDRLEGAGFVHRRRDESDRRRVLVGLIPEAQETIRNYYLPMILDTRRALAEFSDEELEVVCRFLTACTAAYERNLPDR